MAATTYTRPTSFGFTIRASETSALLYIRHDASGWHGKLSTFIAEQANKQELVACGKACQRRYEATGDKRYGAAYRACRRAWAAKG